MIIDKGYTIIEKDKANSTLSHAYMLLCRDSHPETYLKNYAKLLLCDSGSGCGACRSCSLIDKNLLPDCYTLLKDNILVEDVNLLIENTFLKPIEKDKKVYLISDMAGMNARAQNKLLKTLEEPPKSVIFLLATTNEYKVLDTIKSRVKILEMPAFSQEELINQLIGQFSDKQRLLSAIAVSGGYPNKTIDAYQGATELKNLAIEILTTFKKSSQLPQIAKKITKENLAGILGIFKVIFSQMLLVQEGIGEYDQEIIALAREYKKGAILEIEQKISQAERELFYNGNPNMIADTVLFALLEVRYKWQKL